jgi:4-alpha-glucanotransferase
VDVVRVDHFRGFESYWEIPAEHETAIEGRWVKGPGEHFFREIERQLGSCHIIVEDLGLITEDVHALRDLLGTPGMRVLQFAFDGDEENPHLPANYPEHSVAYTGTHDNDTLRGWWESLSQEERGQVQRWIGSEHPSNWDFIRAVFESPASLVIVPLQDLSSMGPESRMNVPGSGTDNWTWRAAELPGPSVAERLRELTRETGRV